MTTTTQSNEKAAPAVQIPVADLRDYFAAKAMQAMLSNDPKNTPYVAGTDDDDPTDVVLVARTAFAVSDAMLRAREAK